MADIIPAVAARAEELVNRVFETGMPIKNERVAGTIKSRPDDVRTWESDWVPFYKDGEITAVAVNVRDITEQIEISDNLRRVLRELEHRVKNMLGNVTALLNQARREVSSDKDVYEKLTRRIEGLAKTHALLTSEQWSSASLRDIIAPETSNVYGEDRVTLTGPELRVNSQTTLALGMAVHELATNAAKYGAFSTDAGQVDVSWSRINDAKSDRLVIEWVERGGPAVSPPDRQGFGSQLISSTLEGTLGGATRATWDDKGLSFLVELDFDEVSNFDDKPQSI